MTLLNRMKKKITEGITVIISIASVISIIFGVYFYNEARYASAKDLKEAKEYSQKIEKRLDQKILNDNVNEIQKRIWLLEDKYEKKQMPDTVKEEYRELKEKKEQLKEELKNLKKSAD